MKDAREAVVDHIEKRYLDELPDTITEQGRDWIRVLSEEFTDDLIRHLAEQGFVVQVAGEGNA